MEDLKCVRVYGVRKWKWKRGEEAEKSERV